MGLDFLCAHFSGLQVRAKMHGTFILGRRKYKIINIELNAQIQNFIKIHPKLRIFYFIGSFLEGQNSVQENRGLLNKVGRTSGSDLGGMFLGHPEAYKTLSSNHIFCS